MNPLLEKVTKALEEVRPFLQRDGGDIRLVSIENATVKIQFLGYCSTCNKSMMTLNGVGAIIKEKVPEITDVIE